MRIRMVQERTGPRHDGRPWPPVGGEIDVDDDECAAVCEHGWAVPVKAERRAEKAVAPPAEERAKADEILHVTPQPGGRTAAKPGTARR